MKVEERTPLAWPEGFPRTKNPERSQFGDHTISAGMDEILKQLRNMRPGVDSCIITANGFLRSIPADKGVAVYFKVQTKWNDQKRCYDTASYVVPCDKWNKIEDNFWAIAKHLEAMRGQRRWGCGSLERDFMGYKALEEKSSGPTAWWQVLGFMGIPNAGINSVMLCEKMYKQLALAEHPDNGGSHERMVELNRAIQEARLYYATKAA